jgi:hypothetical protein
VAALGEAGAKGLKLRKLQKDVAKRVLGSKKQKAIDAMKAAGGPESWATLVGAAAKLVVTPEELGLKFTISGGYVKLA